MGLYPHHCSEALSAIKFPIITFNLKRALVHCSATYLPLCTPICINIELGGLFFKTCSLFVSTRTV